MWRAKRRERQIRRSGAAAGELLPALRVGAGDLSGRAPPTCSWKTITPRVLL
jgi:hypothetical protein